MRSGTGVTASGGRENEGERAEECGDMAVSFAASSVPVATACGGSSSLEVCLNTTGEEDCKRRRKLRSTGGGDCLRADLQPTPFGLSRHLLLFIHIIYVAITARVLFGWPHLSSMLLETNAFSWLCDGEPLSEGTRYMCSRQDSAVQFLFTLGVGISFSFSLVAGILLDYVGPKATACSGQLCSFFGWFLLGFANQQRWVYIPSIVLMALGADAGYLPSMTVAQLYPRHEQLIVISICAAMSLSFSVTTIMELLLRSSSLSFRAICWGFAALGPGLCCIAALLVFPSKPYKAQEEINQQQLSKQEHIAAAAPAAAAAAVAAADGDLHDASGEAEAIELGSSAAASSAAAAAAGCGSKAQQEEQQQQQQQEEQQKQKQQQQQQQQEEEEGVDDEQQISEVSFISQLKSMHFILMWVYWPLNCLFYGFYLTSAENWIGKKGNELLGLLGPVSMIPAVILGVFAERLGVMSLVLFIISNGVLMYVSALLPVSAAQYLSPLFACLYLSNFSGQMYAYVSNTFRSTDFGRVVGFISITGGLIGLLRGPLNNSLTWNLFKGRHEYTCICMMVVAIFCFFIALFLFFVKRRQPKAFIKQQQTTNKAAATAADAAAPAAASKLPTQNTDIPPIEPSVNSD